MLSSGYRMYVDRHEADAAKVRLYHGTDFLEVNASAVRGFEPDDAPLHLELYRNMDPEDAFDHFEEQRETNIETLRDLPPGVGERKALHKKVGPITLSQMLNEWALHDLGHVRQIAELVRARKYLAGAGPLAAFYQLKP